MAEASVWHPYEPGEAGVEPRLLELPLRFPSFLFPIMFTFLCSTYFLFMVPLGPAPMTLPHNFLPIAILCLIHPSFLGA